MSETGLKRARELTVNGFFYDNLIKMAEHCREDSNPNSLLSPYVLNRIFAQMADEMGDGIVISSELRKLEARYRTPVNLALEKAIAGAPQEEQNSILIDLIRLLWAATATD
ncbi:MAG: hypothetical protein JXL84_13750 [Deltaproteobacteria bacterium]|nr:hypothetical protein [Deltaproteobacteria bacterium]